MSAKDDFYCSVDAVLDGNLSLDDMHTCFADSNGIVSSYNLDRITRFAETMQNLVWHAYRKRADFRTLRAEREGVGFREFHNPNLTSIDHMVSLDSQQHNRDSQHDDQHDDEHHDEPLQQDPSRRYD